MKKNYCISFRKPQNDSEATMYILQGCRKETGKKGKILPKELPHMPFQT